MPKRKNHSSSGHEPLVEYLSVSGVLKNEARRASERHGGGKSKEGMERQRKLEGIPSLRRRKEE